jgi:hypothetical protein
VYFTKELTNLAESSNEDCGATKGALLPVNIMMMMMMMMAIKLRIQ